MLNLKKGILDQTIALAAMAQAAHLASQMAMSDPYLEAEFDICVESLLRIDSNSALAIYGDDLKNLQSGLLILAKKNKKMSYEEDFYRIFWSFIRLARLLIASKIAHQFKNHLIRIVEQANYFGSMQHSQVLRNLSDLYLALADKAKLKLKMRGRPKNMQNIDKIVQIRVVLFAGVRAAVLWYQLGGGIFKFLCYRKAYQKKAQEMLASLRV